MVDVLILSALKCPPGKRGLEGQKHFLFDFIHYFISSMFSMNNKQNKIQFFAFEKFIMYKVFSFRSYMIHDTLTFNVVNKRHFNLQLFAKSFSKIMISLKRSIITNNLFIDFVRLYNDKSFWCLIIP